MAGFIIWAICGLFFVGLGIYAFCAKKAVGFWANAKMFEVKDVKGYNHAVAKLWIIFGMVFILCGLPILNGQNSPFILLSILGVMLDAIAAMAGYTLVIEKKYRNK